MKKFGFVDDRFAGQEYFSMKELGRILNIPKMGRNNIIKFLQEKNVLNQYNDPEKEYQDKGYFKRRSHGFSPVLATPEGAAFIADLLEK